MGFRTKPGKYCKRDSVTVLNSSLSVADTQMSISNNKSTVAGDLFDRLEESSKQLMHLSGRMERDLTYRKKNFELALGKALDVGFETPAVSDDKYLPRNIHPNFRENVKGAAQLYLLPANKRDDILSSSCKILDFETLLRKQISEKKALVPLKISPVKAIGHRRRTSTPGPRSPTFASTFGSLRTKTVPPFKQRPQTVGSRAHLGYKSLPIAGARRDQSDSETILHRTLGRMTWDERVAKRKVDKFLQDYSDRRRQWGKILSGELQNITRIARNTLDERRKAWLILIALMKGPYCLEGILAEDREERAQQKAQVEACVRMQSIFRGSFSRKATSKLSKVQQLLLKRLWIIRLNLQTKKRKEHSGLLRQFCVDYCSTSQFKVILKKYRWKIILCQRTIRKFIECKRARVTALMKLWMKFEVPIAVELAAKQRSALEASFKRQQQLEKGTSGDDKRAADKLKEKALKNSLRKAARESAQRTELLSEREKAAAALKLNEAHKKTVSLFLTIRRCKGLARVLDARRNGDMKKGINSALINKKSGNSEKKMRLPSAVRQKYLERIVRTYRKKFINRPPRKSEVHGLQLRQASMMLSGDFTGMTELVQAAKNSQKKPFFKLFVYITERMVEREVYRAFKEYAEVQKRKREQSSKLKESLL